jgi:hypothetical protein
MTGSAQPVTTIRVRRRRPVTRGPRPPPGQHAFHDRSHASEQVRHADQVTADEIAVEPDEREELFQHLFDVDPGQRPGETTITFQYFAIPAVTNEAGSTHDGTTTRLAKPTQKFVFGRRVGRP